MNKKYIYTMYIYSIRCKIKKSGRYRMVILWICCGYLMVRGRCESVGSPFQGRRRVVGGVCYSSRRTLSNCFCMGSFIQSGIESPT